ncbi:unnamed protein product [Phytophthora lilii]|uniref:Unnamed protein product n=1 Tax=Phytophthora lilii TaxID=2077276 RepID=A0A9W6XIJ4_9STRA|nr:unnamed protein product [Phytophthora lilii]
MATAQDDSQTVMMSPCEALVGSVVGCAQLLKLRMFILSSSWTAYLGSYHTKYVGVLWELDTQDTNSSHVGVLCVYKSSTHYKVNFSEFVVVVADEPVVPVPAVLAAVEVMSPAVADPVIEAPVVPVVAAAPVVLVPEAALEVPAVVGRGFIDAQDTNVGAVGVLCV